MFGFSTAPFADPELGELRRSRGLWRGSIELVSGVNVPFALAGSRKEPDPQALALLKDAKKSFSSWRPSIEAALFEHAAPYLDELEVKELEERFGMSGRDDPAALCSGVTITFLSVLPLSGILTTELGYTVPWDDEHTLGARFQNGKLCELNGSVLPP